MDADRADANPLSCAVGGGDAGHRRLSGGCRSRRLARRAAVHGQHRWRLPCLCRCCRWLWCAVLLMHRGSTEMQVAQYLEAAGRLLSAWALDAFGNSSTVVLLRAVIWQPGPVDTEGKRLQPA